MRILIASLVGMLAALPAPVAADSLPAFPFVFATGQASREVAPDIATVNFRIEAFDPTAEGALKIVTERSREVTALLEKHGVADADIVAFDVAKCAVRQNGPQGEPLNILGYETSRPFTATLRDVKRYDALVRGLLGLANVVDVGAGFGVAKPKAIEAALVADAAADARGQAERMAGAAGMKLGAVHALSQADFGAIPGHLGMGAPPGPVAYRMAAAAPGGDLFFVPSTITLQAQINVLYRLEAR